MRRAGHYVSMRKSFRILTSELLFAFRAVWQAKVQIENTIKFATTLVVGWKKREAHFQNAPIFHYDEKKNVTLNSLNGMCFDNKNRPNYSAYLHQLGGFP